MDALIGYISRLDSLSPLNALLVAVLFYIARRRWLDLVSDYETLERKHREHELTFVKYGMEIEREE